MARLLAATGLAALLLAGCTSTDTRYENRGYGYNDGYSRPYPVSRPYYGGPSRPYYSPGRPDYASRDADRYYRQDDNRDHRQDADRRLVKPEKHVVCDRKTEACYKKGDIDASETRDYFGNKAGRRVDKVRDKYDNNDIFIPRKSVVCDKDKRTCYDQGDPSVNQTRDYFGNRAARRVDKDDDNNRRRR